MLGPSAGADPARRAKLVQLLGIDPSWRMNMARAALTRATLTRATLTRATGTGRMANQLRRQAAS